MVRNRVLGCPDLPTVNLIGYNAKNRLQRVVKSVITRIYCLKSVITRCLQREPLIVLSNIYCTTFYTATFWRETPINSFAGIAVHNSCFGAIGSPPLSSSSSSTSSKCSNPSRRLGRRRSSSSSSSKPRPPSPSLGRWNLCKDNLFRKVHPTCKIYR